MLALPLFLSSFYAQTPRSNYDARLEIADVVLHGAGQSPAAFKQYFDYMPAENKPVIYMYYIELKALENDRWVNDLIEQLSAYPDHFILPQIGLSMSDGDDPNSSYEDSVATGVYDSQIGHLVQGLEKLGRPSYLRIGYEFNGLAWNGYSANTYVIAFQRITDAIRLAELEVATVWCSVVGGGTDDNYQSYYPGDNYVDWWAIDLFSVTDFSEPLTTNFMMDAHSSNKPVMIGETTPRFIGADDASDWTDWFRHYYEFIENNAGVKATCYINWNWPEFTDFPQWSDWGNAELIANDFVRVNYVHRLRQNPYFNARSHQPFRQALNYDDLTAPPGVTIESGATEELPIEFDWDPVTDESDVIYEVYKNGSFYRTVYEPFFTDLQYSAGEDIAYTVRAMDWAGNASALSNTLNFELSDTIQKTANATFQEGFNPWILNAFNGAASSFELPGSGINIDIENTTSVNWQIQLYQVFDMLEQNEYFVRTNMSASPGGPVALNVQQNADPFELPLFAAISPGPVATDFTTATFKASEDDEMKMGIFLGELNSGTAVTIHELALFEINGRADFVANEPPMANAGGDILHTNGNEALELDGSGSSDPEGSTTEYAWEQLSGLNVLNVQNATSPVGEIVDFITGEYIFRLTTTDNEGAIGIDEITVTIDTNLVSSISGVSDNFQLAVWPNPASELIYLSIPDEDLAGNYTIQIVDMQGRLLLKQTTTASAQMNGLMMLDVSALTSATYSVQITVNGRRYLSKLIVR